MREPSKPPELVSCESVVVDSTAEERTNRLSSKGSRCAEGSHLVPRMPLSLAMFRSNLSGRGGEANALLMRISVKGNRAIEQQKNATTSKRCLCSSSVLQASWREEEGSSAAS